jgi:hypothetical protein
MFGSIFKKGEGRKFRPLFASSQVGGFGGEGRQRYIIIALIILL